jgi:3-polyprenyl-4-hydroxybenzoate decarboxylase
MADVTTRRRIAVGVTGASGAIYAVRTIAALLEAGCDLEIVFSDYGKRLLLDELGPDAKVERLGDLLGALRRWRRPRVVRHPQQQGSRRDTGERQPSV